MGLRARVCVVIGHAEDQEVAPPKVGSDDPGIAECEEYLPGAGKLHAMQGNIKVRPLERKDINNKLKEMDTSIGVAEPLFDNWVYDGREYGLLKNVSEDGDASALATLGRSHDIKDNISLWNEMNPDNKFSYIRIKTKED